MMDPLERHQFWKDI